MGLQGFIDFIKSIFHQAQPTSTSRRDSSTPPADFHHALREESTVAEREGNGVDTTINSTSSSSPAGSAGGTPPNPAEPSLVGIKIKPGQKFFPLKAYRQTSNGPDQQFGSRGHFMPLIRSSGYPLRVSNCVALNRFLHAPAPNQSTAMDVGQLSAQFESGGDGVGTVGYDPGGGTSYGIYQIASRPGGMDDFISFLKERQSAWARRLQAAGPADTGSTEGAMPTVWKQIAKEDPVHFEQMQRDFIRMRFHEPAAQAIYQSTGLDVDKRSRALQEVLWSTAVQHGVAGARKIFAKALSRLDMRGREVSDEALIQWVYRIRSEYTGSLNADLRASVNERFHEEQNLALSMLRDHSFRA